MCTCKDKTVDTIFYFAPTKAEYNALYIGNEIDARTITFVAETGEIWKNGVLYGKMSEADLKNMIQKITEENPYILPIATKDDADNAHIGGVMGGKYITINTANGSLSIDVNNLFKDPNVNQLVKNIITQEYIENKYVPKTASYDNLGVVQVKRNSGLLINGGLISIDPDSDLIKGATPQIIDGYWYINGKNTGVKALGEKGDKGDKGDNGTGGGNSNIKYLKNIVTWYLVSSLNTGITITTAGWSTTPTEPTPINKYLWEKDLYIYNDNTYTWGEPHISGVYGDRGNTSGGEFNPETDTYILEIKDLVEENHTYVNYIINGELDRIADLITSIDTEILTRVEQMLKDAEWVQENWPAGETEHTGWVWTTDAETGVKLFLSRVGLWTLDEQNNIVTTLWTDIRQQMDSVVIAANTLQQFDNDKINALQALLNVYSGEEGAGTELSAFIAKLDDHQKVLQWLYSGLKSNVSLDGQGWNDLVTAAKNTVSGQWAAGNLHTEVIEDLEGNFVSKTSLISEVNDILHNRLAAAGIISQAENDWALTTNFARVNSNGFATQASLDIVAEKVDNLNAYSQAALFADTTIYEILMTKDKDGNDVPALDENGRIQYVYEDSLWVITNEDGWTSTLNGKPFTYPKGAIVDRNPGMYGEPAKKLKSDMTGGLITYSDADKALAQLFAEDKMNGTKAEITAIVAEGQSEVNIEANRLVFNGDEALFNSNGEFIGDVNAKSFTAGELGGIHIKTQGDQIQFVKGEEVVGYFEIAEADNSYGLQLYLKKAGETGYYHVNWDNWTSDTLRRWVNAGYYLVQAAGKIGNNWLSPAINPKFQNIVTNERLASIYNMILGTGSLSPVKQYLTSDSSESYINDTYNTVQDKNSTYPWFIGIPSSGTQWNKYTTLSDLNGVIRADIEQTVVQSIEALGYTTEDLSSSSNDLSIINIHESDNTLTDPIYVIHAQLVTASGAQDVIGLANESKLLSLI